MSSDYTDAIVGQRKLKELVANYNLTTLPRSIILLGDTGCGKHLLCDYIADKFQLKKYEVNSKLTPDQLENICNTPYPILCIFNLGTLDLKFQFSLLKTLEEPRSNFFAVCISTGSAQVLPTLLNRCQLWTFSSYSREELSVFIDSKNSAKKDLLLDMFHTPGQLKEAQSSDIDSMSSIAYNIIYKIKNASLPNILSISDKIAFKNEKGKHNLDLFVRTLEYCILKVIQRDSTKIYLQMFEEIIRLRSKLLLSINKQHTFEGFLMALKGM